MNHSFNQKIIDIFQRSPDEIFVFDALSERELTYRQFFGAILNARDALIEQGLKQGDIVCLFMQNSLDLMVLYFAAMVLGLIVVPLDPHKGTKEIDDILAQFHYKLLISDSRQDLPATIESSSINERFYRPREVVASNYDAVRTIDNSATYLMTFTSGSTGVPKGVKHTLWNLLASAEAFDARFHFGSRRRFYHNLPMTYMAGILNLMLLPFIAGSKIIIGERFSIANALHFWQLPIRYQADTFWLIPAVVAFLLQFDRGMEGVDYARTKSIIGCVGTAPLNFAHKLAFEAKYKIPLYESYGLSETLFNATNYPGSLEKKNSVGPALPGVRLRFGDDQEILVDVPWMFQGYSNTDASKEFDSEYFRSGDLGRVDTDGLVFITGRKKDIIIRGGINISPRSIEDFIADQRIFNECVVLSFTDENLGEKVVCFFTPREQGFDEQLAARTREAIIRQLGQAYQIDEFVAFETMPRNTNGKIDKLKIREIYTTNTSGNQQQ